MHISWAAAVCLSGPILLTVESLLRVVHSSKGPLEEHFNKNVHLLIHLPLLYQNAGNGTLHMGEAT